ncbi:unnamed protein product [Ilex paraguariensis]|uniref:Uncharacterized protein n=1 Tax=Ilex paraguariensis TaxID=185542 RepID=A0ABC8RHN7_9AQUA
MATEKNQDEMLPSAAATTPAMASCRKKKSTDATFLEDLKDHMDEFIYASMDEHKTCFKKTIQKVLLRMATEKNQDEMLPSAAATTPAMASCRKKKSTDATFLEDLKDHMDEFIYASMDEHKTCFKKTIQKMFGMSKVVAERSSKAKEVESSLPLQTTLSE